MTTAIQTYTGKFVDPLMLGLDDIDIIDIAHALSNQCRFTGHVARFLSVAEHSVAVAYLCSLEQRLAGLLHDASEAYLVDLPKPLKMSSIGDGFRDVEERIQRAIFDRYGLEWPIANEVHEADTERLIVEAELLLPHGIGQAKLAKAERLLLLWSPEEAEREFLELFKSLVRGPA